MLSGGADRSNWVRNLLRDPAVTVRIGGVTAARPGARRRGPDEDATAAAAAVRQVLLALRRRPRELAPHGAAGRGRLRGLDAGAGSGSAGSCTGSRAHVLARAADRAAGAFRGRDLATRIADADRGDRLRRATRARPRCRCRRGTRPPRRPRTRPQERRARGRRVARRRSVVSGRSLASSTASRAGGLSGAARQPVVDGLDELRGHDRARRRRSRAGRPRARPRC